LTRSAPRHKPENAATGNKTASYYGVRSHDAVTRVYDEADNVIETHRHKDDQFMKSLKIFALILLLLPSVALAQSKSLLIEDLTWTEVRHAIAAGKTTAIYYAASSVDRRGVLLLRRLFFRKNPRLRQPPQLQPALLRLSAINREL
jgi:hypothetical protein